MTAARDFGASAGEGRLATEASEYASGGSRLTVSICEGFVNRYVARGGRSNDGLRIVIAQAKIAARISSAHAMTEIL